MTLDADACAELAQKYATLGELRRARSRGEAIPERAVFRALARRFPGCLNELDTLPLDEIDERCAALRRASAGAPVEPWMAWVWDYHRLLREALALKIRLGREPSSAISPEDHELVRKLTALPNGRLVPVVLDRVAALHEAPVDEIARTIFARRR